MSNNLKIRSPWSQLALFLLLLAGSLVLFSVIAGICLSVAGFKDLRNGLDLNNPATLAAAKLLQGFSSVIVFGLPAWFYAQLTFREHGAQKLGFRAAPKSILYLLGIILLLGSLPLEAWLGQLNKQIPLPASLISMEKEKEREVLAFITVHSNLDIVINLFVMAVLPGIFEELCFRGALQRILIQCFKSPWGGIIVTGIIFSAIHMEFQGFLPRTLLGILLGAAYWYSGSLWTPILAHFFFNGIQVVMASFYPKLANDNPSIPTYLGLFSAVIVTALLMHMRRLSTTTYDQVYGPKDDFVDFLSNQVN